MNVDGGVCPFCFTEIQDAEPVVIDVYGARKHAWFCDLKKELCSVNRVIVCPACGHDINEHKRPRHYCMQPTSSGACDCLWSPADIARSMEFALANLRKKVEALSSFGEGDEFDVVLKSEVLALIDEEMR